MDVQNRLAALRTARGVSAAEMASAAGVSRQTIYAIESGSFAPNTAVALRLAQKLGVAVEDVFQLDEQPAAAATQRAEMLAGAPAVKPGAPVRLCRVNGRLIAIEPEAHDSSLPVADAMVSEARGRPSVEPFDATEDFAGRLLIAGCDPGASILARHMQRQGFELVVARRNSTQALDLLQHGSIHVAGCHIHDEKTGESNLAAIGSRFRKQDVAVISLAMWEEGLVIATGNPKRIHTIADLARRDVSIVNREPGAGSRMLLDARLRSLGMARKSLRGYDRIALGHLPATRRVLAGEADCCVATSTVARMLGLGFVALASARYDLVVRRRHLELPQVQALFNTLAKGAFRHELACMGGYDTAVAGQRLM